MTNVFIMMAPSHATLKTSGRPVTVRKQKLKSERNDPITPKPFISEEKTYRHQYTYKLKLV